MSFVERLSLLWRVHYQWSHCMYINSMYAPSLEYYCLVNMSCFAGKTLPAMHDNSVYGESTVDETQALYTMWDTVSIHTQ